MVDKMPGDVVSNSPPDTRSLWAWVLIAGGVLLAVFASGLGTLLVQQPHSNGSISWSPDEANAAATTLRCLGFLAFAGGYAERIILAIADSATQIADSATQKDKAVSGGRIDNSDLK